MFLNITILWVYSPPGLCRERAAVVVVVVGGCAVSGRGDAATMLTDTALSEAGTSQQ